MGSITDRSCARLFLLAVCVAMCSCESLKADHVTSRDRLQAELRPIRRTTVDQRFFSLIDLDAPGLERTRDLVKQREYAKALDAWRDYVVMKMRARTVGKMRFHTNRQNKSFGRTFDVLLGKTPPRQKDTANMFGPPNRDRRIHWLDTEANFLQCEPGTRTNLSLVAYFQKTRDPVYLAKWLEIAEDFCVYQKKMEQSLPAQERAGSLPYPSRNRNGVKIQWSTQSHQVNLTAAGRAHDLVKGLFYAAKALHDGGEPRDWATESMLPIDRPLEPGAMDLIPSEQLANIAISLVYDLAPALLEVYGPFDGPHGQRAPNQRFSGLTGVAGIAYAFDEFRASKAVAAQGGAALENYVETTILPDGGDLEQSFNYNIGFFPETDEYFANYPEGPNRPRWVRMLWTAVLQRQRLFAGLMTPLGILPRIGTYGAQPVPLAWRESAGLTEWEAELAKSDVFTANDDPVARSIYNQLLSKGGAEPPFTSVAFPFAGYYAMRDGWSTTSKYLWLMGARRGGGHSKQNINGIQVTAYGRNLLVSNGPPPYGQTFVEPDQKQYYNQMREYFGEHSSTTTNTILVDMKSQSRFTTPPPKRAYQTPIHSRWLSSDTYDVAEASYHDGYGGTRRGEPAPINVTHDRDVVFLRKHGLWLVTDRIIGDGNAHTYQQQWHFPPPHEDKGRVSPGFTNEQVLIDNSKHIIRTADPAGPNIALHQFAPISLEYKRYFGQVEPWLGWYSMGIGGKRYPSVDLHTCWEGKGDMVVTTAIIPSPDEEDMIAAASDLSDPQKDIAGCRLTLKDGAAVHWLAAQNTATLEAAGIKVEAESLLVVVEADGSISGIVLGRRHPGAASVAQSDYEFKMVGGAVQMMRPITYPTEQLPPELRRDD